MKKLITSVVLLLLFLTEAKTQITLDLQPGADDGIDAEIFSCIPCGYHVRNFGKIGWFDAIAWTKDGHKSNVRSLLHFDLSSIPQGAQIISARLSLYFAYDKEDELTHFNGQNYCHTGSNAAVLQRIIEPWEEFKVTWKNQPKTTSYHQVVLPGSAYPTQDYPNINVRKLVQDMVNDPGKSFGFMLKLKKEKKYKKLLFASSDNRNDALWPRLQIRYSLSPLPPLPNGDVGSGGGDLLSGFKIIPNPAFRESVELYFYSPLSFQARITVTGITGNVVLSKSVHVEEGENYIWLEEAAQWQRGIYIMKLRAFGQVYTQKFIIL